MQRKSLSDILHGGDRDKLSEAWNSTEAAGDFAAIPAGTYDCHVINGEAFTSRTNQTPGYKLAFKVIEGEFAGRQFWNDLWLTPAALPMTKRDLAKLGVVELKQLDRPLPRGIRCQVKVALRTTDDGTQFNAVRSFDVIGIDEPVRDAFAPPPESAKGDAAEPTGEVDTSFNAESFDGKGAT